MATFEIEHGGKIYEVEAPDQAQALAGFQTFQQKSASPLQGFRQQYPQYPDMSDNDLGTALHGKYYSDIPKSEFDAKVGLPSLPAGFVLDSPASQQPLPKLPAGYVLDEPTAGPWERFQGKGDKGPWTKYQQPQPEPISADNIARSIAQGVPILGGAMDKFAAGMDALTNPVLGRGAEGGSIGERYSKNISAETARTQNFETAHPIVSTTANIAGGVGALGAASRIPGVAYSLGVSRGPMLGNMIRGAASNSVIGGADSAVRGGDIGTGATVGGLLGAAAPPVGRVLGASFERLLNRSASNTAFAGPATSRIERAMSADALDPRAMQSRLAEMGPDAMFADLGPNLRGQAEALAAQPGPGQRVITSAVEGRNNAASGRITDALDSTMGAARDPVQLADQIIATRSAQAAPLYKEAYATPIKLTPGLKSVLDAPAGKAALAKAARLSANAIGEEQGMFGQLSHSPDILEAAQAGRINPGQYKEILRQQGASSVDVRGLDLTKRALDDMADAAKRAGKNNEARIIGNLRDTLLREVDRQAPKYAAARDVYSSETAIKDALDGGREVFARNVTPSELSKTIRGMSSGEREAFQHGARSAIVDIMGSARNEAQAANALFQKGWTKEKLSMILGQDAAASLGKVLARESNFASTGQTILNNSRTAARTAAGREFPSTVANPTLPHGMTAIDAALFIPRKIGGAILGNAQRGRAENISRHAADALSATGPTRDRMVQEMFAGQSQRGLNAVRRQESEHALMLTLMGLPNSKNHAGLR